MTTPQQAIPPRARIAWALFDWANSAYATLIVTFVFSTYFALAVVGDAQHLAAELVVKYSKDRKPLGAVALTTDTSALTAIGNDYGYENVFSRQVEALAETNGIFIALSTSGNSPNVVKACAMAKKPDVELVALSKRYGETLAVDGISLTVAGVTKTGFRLWIIPHTFAVTALRERQVGDAVNLEADLLGKYVDQLLSAGERSRGKARDGAHGRT